MRNPLNREVTAHLLNAPESNECRRLTSGTTTVLGLNRQVTFEHGSTYYIAIRYPDGTLVTYNSQRHAMLATIADSGKGAEVTLKYSR